MFSTIKLIIINKTNLKIKEEIEIHVEHASIEFNRSFSEQSIKLNTKLYISKNINYEKYLKYNYVVHSVFC